jgi:dihydrofolate reductase
VVESYSGAGRFILGRHTYETLAAYWPNASEEEQVVARPLNTLPKYVASTTLAEPLEWENSSLLQGDVPQAVRGLKEDKGKDMHVMTTGAIITNCAPAGERSSRRS